MLKGLLTVSLAFLIFVAVGAFFGIFVGALTQQFLLWVGIMAVVGGAFGIAVGYGFLPES
jgi:hypothetical protein